ncbi:MAG: MFS transporter [Novosphingobium sp.]|nr:MFS transporter [Novosphingobium sp.]
MNSARTKPASEWRKYWYLPTAAAIGFSTIGLQSYGLGPFVTHIEAEFGWSRSDVMLGLSLSNFVGVFLNILVGMVVDRFGPRHVALTGLVVKTGAFALLGTATGLLFNWLFLWFLVALGIVLVQATVWTAAVATRFDRHRGSAFAVTLSGSGVTAALAPVIATWLIADYGWRVGFIGVGAVWLLVTFPVTLLFFRDTRSERRKPAVDAEQAASPTELPGLTLREGIRTLAFAQLAVSFVCYAFYNMTMAANLVPLLMETGQDQPSAARIAAVMGIVGIIARLSVGFLLDRYPGNIIGGISQILPVIACGLLLADLPGIWPLLAAMVAFGIATGAEMDVTIYMATRHFGLKAFAALFGAVITCGAVAAAIGPVTAGWLHDLMGNYDGLLILVMVVMTIGSLAIGTMRRGPAAYASVGH